MKYFFIILFLSPTLLFAGPLERSVETTLRLPEAWKLYQCVCREGRVTFREERFPHKISTAMWRADQRAIILNRRTPMPEGQRIASILFELHNAHASSRFYKIDMLAHRGKLTREQYVEAIERIEYDNARKTCHLLEKGIALGLYPPSARWPIADDFKTHYRIQKWAGHSSLIAQNYDMLVYAHHS